MIADYPPTGNGPHLCQDTVAELLELIRFLSTSHTPDEWPAVRMRVLMELGAAVTRLQGEADVMRGLLRAAHDVIDTVEGETAPECEMLQDLKNKIRAAYQGSI